MFGSFRKSTGFFFFFMTSIGLLINIIINIDGWYSLWFGEYQHGIMTAILASLQGEMDFQGHSVRQKIRKEGEWNMILLKGSLGDNVSKFWFFFPEKSQILI